LSALIGGCDQPQASSTSREGSARADAADLVIKELAADPQFVWFSTLKRLYPSDYAEVADALRTQIADADDIVAARVAMAEAVKPIMLRHKEAAKLASDKQLVEYLRRNTRVAEALAGEDVKACNDVFHGALDPRIELPNSTWKLMSEATAQLLIAAKDGETAKTARSDNRLSKEDFAAWTVAMEKVGANTDTFDLINNPARKAAATDEEKCRVRIQMMKGALGLPEPLAAKIMLSVL
jgi:hypothetical protein